MSRRGFLIRGSLSQKFQASAGAPRQDAPVKVKTFPTKNRIPPSITVKRNSGARS